VLPKILLEAVKGGSVDLGDVKYDAFLANRRPLSDPDVIRALPGRAVRLRIINAASGTNFFIRTGALRAEAIAVDGAEIAPLPGRVFELAVAQRIDLRVRIPRGPGAYPILAQGEGTDMRAGLVLATPDASVPRISAKASRAAGALSNAQEKRLVPLRPLAPRAVDRTIRVGLNGDMARYTWTLNGRAWPDIVPLAVRNGPHDVQAGALGNGDPDIGQGAPGILAQLVGKLLARPRGDQGSGVAVHKFCTFLRAQAHFLDSSTIHC